MNSTNNDTHIPLAYWRAALAEVSLLHPVVPPEAKPIAIGVIEGRWRISAAEPDTAAWVAAQFAASKANVDQKTRTIPLVLINARLSPAASHGVKQEAADVHAGLTVLCVPCLLDRDGLLLPDPDRHPWIPRDLLEPTLKAVSIGQLTDYDAFASSLHGKPTSLDDTLETAAALFAAVTGSSLPLLPPAPGSDDAFPVFALEGQTLVSGWRGLPYEPPIIARHLIKLYDQLIADTPPTPLLDTLRAAASQEAQRPRNVEEGESWHARTVGHLNPRHPLSPSQREAMVELARLGDGQVLAVNGPPGTGKTTLLQSVVAQVWIDAALRRGDCPLIVVTSTNVKAVENVLDSFAHIASDTGHERWHPYDGGFGLFLASRSRETKHPSCTSDGHPYAEYETTDGLAAAEAFFLARASRFFEQELASVSEAVDLLHEQLGIKAARIEAIVAARYALYRETGGSTDAGAADSFATLDTSLQVLADGARADLDVAQHALDAARRESHAADAAYESRRGAIARAEKDWNAYLAASPFWLDLFSFLPVVKRRRKARDRHFLMGSPLTEDLADRDDGVDSHFGALKSTALAARMATHAAVAERCRAIESDKGRAAGALKAAEDARRRLAAVWEQWQAALLPNLEHMLDVSLGKLNEALDTALRAPMFRFADWYWSGTWLREVAARLAASEKDTKGRARLEAKYRRFAKLSPCLVSNFHMAPSFFTAWQGADIPLWNNIDLLIVDEAGQVAPDVAAPMFALARRALVVGDTWQIEPVWNNGEATDRVNAVKFGITPHPHDAQYDDLAYAGFASASGNLMRIANRSCLVQKYPDMRGLMLTEHRRCVPQLVAYCNALIYGGRLEPKRPALPAADRVLPPFGYVNVEGKDRQAGGSRRNEDEARAIVAWLLANRTRIEQHYQDASLHTLVGIVTPFAAQARSIENQLRKTLPDLMRKDARITVGTVHALQGAERAIVIFSPTYGSGYKGGTFFDQKPNMLNVAVSRAKDSFLIMGNLGLFDATKPSRPSGLLARFLFQGGASAAL